MQRIIRRLHTTNLLQHIRSSIPSLPTDFFQKSLPYLPYPDLKVTLSHFLEQRSVVMETKAFQQLQKLTNEFLMNDGRILDQMLLEEYKQDKTVYGGDQCIDSNFRWRNSILRQTYGCMETRANKIESQLVIASKLLYCNGLVQKSLRDNTYKPFMLNSNPVLEEILLHTPEQQRTQVALALGVIPFNMDAYKKTLSGTRIPAFGKDVQHVATDSKNVVIIRNGNIFSFDLIQPNGNLLTTAEILMNLETIKVQSEVMSNPPVAVLTAMERDMWTEYRNHMLLNSQNAKALKQIEDAIVVLTLDGEYDAKTPTGKVISLGQRPGDRWFDRNIAISVDKSEGLLGGLGNSTETHAGISANVQDVALDIFENMGLVVKDDTTSPTPVEKLTFVVDDKIREGIEIAKREFYEFYNNYECVHFEMNNINRKVLGRSSPDSLMHVAIQITFMKLLGRPQNVISPVVIPTFANGHYAVTFAPWKSTIELANMYISKGKIDLATLRMHSNKYVSMLMQMRLGLLAPEPHLRALTYFAEITGKGQEFLESELVAGSLLAGMDSASLPNDRPKKMVLTGYNGAMGFGHLLKNNTFCGTFTSGDKDKPSPESFRKVFTETVDGLLGEIIKQTN